MYIWWEDTDGCASCFCQRPQRDGPPVRPSVATPALKQTRWPRTLWNSWRTSRNLAGRSTNTAELSSWTCQARRSVGLDRNHLLIVWRKGDECPTCRPFRTWAQKSCPSASRISTRTCPTAWWVTSKVGLSPRLQSRTSRHRFSFH